MNYPLTGHEAMGQRKRTEDHGKVIFASVFFFAIIHPTFKHAPGKESTIWNFSMISAEKVPGSFDFCHHRGVDFAG